MKGINSKVIFAVAMAVLAFVIMGIVTSIGATLMQGVQDTQGSSGTVVNDTLTFTANDTAGAQSFTITPATTVTFAGNASNMGNLAGNYSYNSTHAWLLINCPLAGCLAYTAYNFTYGVTTYSIAYRISGNASSGLTNVGNQLPLIGTILIFGAIITLLITVFWFKKKGSF